MGFLLREQGRYDEALSAFDRAVEIDPQYTMAWNNRGTTLASLGRYDEAILACDKAIETGQQLYRFPSIRFTSRHILF
jgi:tetratricopeptide (TPR) repeat protein